MNEPIDRDYESTPEGREAVALLQRHAPPPTDERAGARAVLDRLDATQPRGRLLHVRWLAPLAGAAAAAVVVALVLINPGASAPTQDDTAESAREDAPVPEVGTITHAAQDLGDIRARVRRRTDDGPVIDAGLRHGLRVGDRLEGPDGAVAEVRDVGIFVARVRVAKGSLAVGDRLAAPISTDAQVRTARFESLGGDPGAFYRFGAVFSAMETTAARLAGIASGEALRVDEVIPAVLVEGDEVVLTLAARLGLQRNDILLEVNGSSVGNAGELAAALGWSLDPRLVTVTVIRDGRQLDLRAG